MVTYLPKKIIVVAGDGVECETFVVDWVICFVFLNWFLSLRCVAVTIPSHEYLFALGDCATNNNNFSEYKSVRCEQIYK